MKRLYYRVFYEILNVRERIELFDPGLEERDCGIKGNCYSMVVVFVVLSMLVVELVCGCLLQDWVSLVVL